MKTLHGLAIKIWETEQDEGGYIYDIFDTDDVDDDVEAVDGGFCTGTLEDALEMAFDQTRTVLRPIKK